MIRLDKNDWIEAQKQATEMIKQGLRMVELNNLLLKLAERNIKLCEKRELKQEKSD